MRGCHSRMSLPSSLIELPRKSRLSGLRTAHSPANQHGNFRVGHDLVRHASDQERGKSAAPMPRHHDEVAAVLFRRCDDGLIGRHILHLNVLAGNAGLPATFAAWSSTLAKSPVTARSGSTT